MTDDQRPLTEATYRQLAARLPRDSLFIIRHRQAKAQKQLLQQVQPLLARYGHILSVANSKKLAIQHNAQALHFSEAQLRQASLLSIRQLSQRFLITGACHSRAALSRAHKAGCHAVMLSPLRPTPSHPGASGLGLYAYLKLAQHSHLPFYALGGVTFAERKRLRSCRQLAGLAGLGLFVTSPHHGVVI